MKEHDDDLEVGVSAVPTTPETAEIAAAIRIGLERIATALECGLGDLARAIESHRSVERG